MSGALIQKMGQKSRDPKSWALSRIFLSNANYSIWVVKNPLLATGAFGPVEHTFILYLRKSDVTANKLMGWRGCCVR